MTYKTPLKDRLRWVKNYYKNKPLRDLQQALKVQRGEDEETKKFIEKWGQKIRQGQVVE